MPLTTDAATLETSKDLVGTLQQIFGKHPGFRPAHAKGHHLKGVFTPSASAGALSSAPHFNNPSTPILARFSTSTGLPQIPDTDKNTLPHGLAVRFNLPSGPDGRRKHTDIIAHSTPTFPMRTGEGFLAMLGVLKTGDMSVIGKFLQENPSAQAHVARKQEPVASYADDVYYGVNAFKLVSASGEGTYVRWRFEPVEGVKYISGEEYEAQGPGYLREELASRLPGNPIKFRLVVQVAEEGDVTDDATVHWPEERKVVELGVLELNELLEGEESLRIEKNTIYDPIPRVEGVEPSADPLLEMRAAVYLMSGKERRAA